MLSDRGPVGRSGALFVEGEFRRGSAFARFLDAVRAVSGTGGGALVEIREVAGELSTPGVGEVLRSRGYRELRRLDMIYPTARPLFAPPDGTPPSLRPLSPADAPALAVLLERAYSDNPEERAVFLRDHDPAEDARRGVEELLGGTYGPLLYGASFVVEGGEGELAAATLVNDFAGPLISEVVVAPAHRRRGLARSLLRATLGELRRVDPRSPRLVVTTSNVRARRLYERLGFEPIEGTEGTLWLDEAALGIPPGFRPPP